MAEIENSRLEREAENCPVLVKIEVRHHSHRDRHPCFHLRMGTMQSKINAVWDSPSTAQQAGDGLAWAAPWAPIGPTHEHLAVLLVVCKATEPPSLLTSTTTHSCPVSIHTAGGCPTNQ